jgi:hypothetical protein
MSQVSQPLRPVLSALVQDQVHQLALFAHASAQINQVDHPIKNFSKVKSIDGKPALGMRGHHKNSKKEAVNTSAQLEAILEALSMEIGQTGSFDSLMTVLNQRQLENEQRLATQLK